LFCDVFSFFFFRYLAQFATLPQPSAAAQLSLLCTFNGSRSFPFFLFQPAPVFFLPNSSFFHLLPFKVWRHARTLLGYFYL